MLVHIGTEKTGTTTLQDVLAASADALAAAGYHLLTTPGRTAARDIAAAAVGDGYDEFIEMELRLTDDERAAFAEEVTRRVAQEAADLPAGVHTVIVSSEHFHSRLTETGRVRRLAEMLAPLGGDVEVLCYLRPQAELITSHYSTRLRMGETRTLDDVAHSLLRTDVPYGDYLGLLERYAGVFGEDRITVRIFDRDALVGGDIVTDFAAAVGFDPGLLVDGVDALNTSISSAGQEVLRVFNRHHDDLRPGVGPYRMAKTIADAFPGRGDQLSPEMAERSQRVFAADNEEVRRRFRPDLATLFASPATDSRDAGSDGTPGRPPAERVYRTTDAVRIEDLETHVAELEADVGWLNRELNVRPIALVRRLLRRPASRLDGQTTNGSTASGSIP